MQKADKDSIKRNNKKVILNQLKFGEFSRTEIARRTGLSHSTVSTLVSELSREGIIFEKSQAQSSGGRKPINLSICPNGAYALLIKLSRNSAACALVNLTLQVILEQYAPISAVGEDAVKEAIDSCLGDLLAESGQIISRIVGIGLCVQGVVDFENETILLSSLLKLRNIDLKPMILAHINRPILLFRDTDAMMMGEYILSSLKPTSSYVYLLIESGVGLSVMWKGRIVQPYRSGFEVGHIKIADNGIRCNCGNIGCVETLVGETAANRELRRLSANGPGTETPSGWMTLTEIAHSAADGDLLCLQVLLEQGRYIGQVVSSMVNLFAPDMVFIGGPLSGAGAQVHQAITEAAASGELDVYKQTPIRFTATADRAAFVGLADRVYRTELFGVI